MTNYYNIIKNIHLTEKSTILSEKNNQYVFQVNIKSNKIQIRQAIEKIFSKKVVKVNTSTYQGKFKRGRTQNPGRTNHWKKAIVTLAPGEKIELA